MEFEWDLPKAAANVRKHGVTFDEAATVFLDEIAVSGADPDHSVGEARYITFGTSRLAHRVWVSCSRSRTHTAQLRYASSVHGG